MAIIIRDYRPDDWPAICRVHDRARPDELRGSFDARAFIPLAEDPESEYINACAMFVAQRGDVVVGFAGIDEPYLAWLYVDPAHYRRGIGRALLRHCLARLSDDAWTRACGNNDVALSLYLSEGFVIESRSVGENAGYEGPSARLALHPERQGWTRPRRSKVPEREATARWENLTLPEADRQRLRELAGRVKHGASLPKSSGHSAKNAGVAVLFAGPSGTGKTMAAEVLAKELGLALYRVDLRQIVSKYIGETEKNLQRVFEEAEQSGAMLFFDEADALFGKRSDVKDSHDRYANTEIAYLLQRIEDYSGLVILATNRRSAVDEATMRRFACVIEFA